MPSRVYQAGETVYVRATILVAQSDAFQIRIEDYPHVCFTAWAPHSEVARFEDIGLLRPKRSRADLL